jgi:Mor family transcriptional regulator
MKKGERGDLTKFSKGFWEMAVAYGGSNENVLRDYDILQERKRGLTYEQLAIKFNLSRVHIIRICNK